jgi:hypothetical protein
MLGHRARASGKETISADLPAMGGVSIWSTLTLVFERSTRAGPAHQEAMGVGWTGSAVAPLTTRMLHIVETAYLKLFLAED